MHNKRGQVAIFVIVALVIVAIIGIVYIIRGGVPFVATTDVDPEGFLKSCIESEAVDAMDVLSVQGGYLNPEGFVLHEGKEIKYLCYSSEYYKRCVVQQPMITEHFEKEIEDILGPKAEVCVMNLEKEYEKRNSDVSTGAVGIDVEIENERVNIKFESPMTIVKSGDSKKFDGFDINIASKMGNLLGIAKTIVDFESTYGDFDSAAVLPYYPNLIIEKDILGDGTTIYEIRSAVTEEKFVFASRSIVWPAGYGLPE